MKPDQNTYSMFAGFFIPMALIYVLISMSIHLIQDIRDVYVIHLSGSETLAGARLATDIIGASIFILLLIIGRRYPLRKICFAVFLLFPIFIGIWTLFLMPFQESQQALKEWQAAIYYIGTSLWIGGSFFFFWAFANNHFSFKQAGLFYPYFFIISLLMNYPLNSYLHPFMMEQFKNYNPNYLIINLNLTLLAIGIIIFAIYASIDYLLPRIRHSLELRNEKVDRLFGLSYRLVIGLFMFAIAFLTTLTTYWLQVTSRLEYPYAAGREPLISALGVTVHATNLISIVFLIPLSFYLYHSLGKAWRTIAYAAAGVMTLCSIIWYSLAFSRIVFPDILDAASAHHVIFAFITPFVFVLKEMSFIVVPKAIRFITKTWVDLFFWAVGFFGARVIIAGLTLTFGSLFSALPYLFIITLAVLFILIGAAHIAGKRIQTFTEHLYL